MTTASEIGDGQVTGDVLLLGAAGNSGRLIAAELAGRGLSVPGQLYGAALVTDAIGATGVQVTVNGQPA